MTISNLYKIIKKLLNQNYLLKLVTKYIREADDFLVTKTRRRKYILFGGNSPIDFVIFMPIYKKLVNDKRLVINFINTLEGNDFYKNFGNIGVDFLGKHCARLKKWDLYITSDYSEQPAFLRKTKMIIVPHGIGDKKAAGIAYMVREELLKYDRVFFANKTQYLEFNAKFGKKAEKISILSGFQMIDYLTKDNFDQDAIKKRLKINATLPIILFAPSWGEYGALNTFGSEIIEKLLSLKANILVKLHDGSFCHDPCCKNKLDWRKEIKFYSRIPNFFEIKDYDPYPYLRIADILISDYGSLVFVFQAMKKPVIFFSIDEHNKKVVNDPDKLKLLEKACITIHNPHLLDNAINKAKEYYYKDNPYKEIIRKRYFENLGNSTETIVNEIYDLLKINRWN